MADQRLAVRLMDEAVAAVAGILDATIALRHAMHVVAEQTAEIPDAFLEAVPRVVWIGVQRKQQRMSASHAGVFHVSVARADRFVRVMAQETRQRVPDAHRRGVVAQQLLAAARAVASLVDEYVVIDRVAPDEADQPGRHSHLLPADRKSVV